MRRFLKCGLLFVVLSGHDVFGAGTPENGWYAGVDVVGMNVTMGKFLLTSSQVSALNQSLTTAPATIGGPFRPITSFPGRFKYGFGGGAAVQAGYRYSGFRFEGELLASYNTVSTISIDQYVFGRHYITTQPAQAVSGSGGSSSIIFPYSMSGHLQFAAGLVNVLYDFYRHDTDRVSFFPYIGVGLGGARMQNRWVININTPTTSGVVYTPVTRSRFSLGKPLTQGILGLGFQLDDYFSVFADYRYLTSAQIKFKTTQSRITFNTFALGFNYWFNA